MYEAIFLAQIIGSRTYWGIIEGDIQSSGLVSVMTPACLNRVSELPRVEEREGRLAIRLSLRCLCELFNHLRSDKDRKLKACLAIDGTKHEHIYDGDNASSKLGLVTECHPRPRTAWRRATREQWERARNTDGEDVHERT